jgi:hypothetical protein
MNDEARLYSPAAARNREPIFHVLERHLPQRGLVLEIASGSGEHIVHFARNSEPGLTFQPSDPDPSACASIDAWSVALGLSNVRPAVALDAELSDWHLSHADAVLCINMIHIAPWTATIGLMRGAAQLLPSGCMLYLYGPFRRTGEHTAPSNEQFDQALRNRNSAWGARHRRARGTGGRLWFRAAAH